MYFYYLIYLFIQFGKMNKLLFCLKRNIVMQLSSWSNMVFFNNAIYIYIYTKLRMFRII